MKIRNILLQLFSVIAVFLMMETITYSSEYVIGTDDILQISFWQAPDLDASVQVSVDGKITLDIIGRINAAGRTTEELEREIVRRIAPINKRVSQASVSVTAFNYNYLFVIGQSKRPGKYSFEEIPDLWTVINEAGGITEIGDLSRVAIIHGGKRAGKVEIVDITSAIVNGTLNKLPALEREDTIEIPRVAGGVNANELGQSAQKKNLIYIMGAVGRPGPITYENGIDIAEALALAGGPTADADLKDVRLILKEGRYAQSIRIDLDKYSKTGKPGRYILNREDMFIVPHEKQSFLRQNFGTIIQALGVVTTLFVLYDRIGGNDNNANNFIN